jgi:HAD superfamily phosphatase (TIGR01668 family)
MRLIRLLKPCEAVATVFDIDYAGLRASGKRAVLFDLDNTLRKKWSETLFPDVEGLLARLGEMGFRIGVITNRKYVAHDSLVHGLARRMAVTCRAGKPRRRGYLALLSRLSVLQHEAVMVGDRRLTDILGGNRLGLHTILVTRARERVPQRRPAEG